MKNAVFAFAIFWAIAVFVSSPTHSIAQSSDAKANEMFVEAVTLFHQSSDLQKNEQAVAYTKVRSLLDMILSQHPDSFPAQVIREGGSPGGVVLSKLPEIIKPKGWNDGKRGIARDLLAAYSEDTTRLKAVADATDFAILSWAAYENDEGLDAARKSAWQPTAVFLGQSFLAGDAVATLFVGPDDQHVLAFRGTTTGKDWVTNTAGTFSASPLILDQVNDAARIGTDVKKLFPDVIFTGHSLGGRLAQVASLATGNKAYAFNSAPLGLNEAKKFGIKIISSDGIVRFRSPQDPVSRILPQQDNEVSNIVEANILSILRPENVVGYTHAMSVLAQAMISVQTAWDEGWIDAFLVENGKAHVGSQIEEQPEKDRKLFQITSPAGIPLRTTTDVNTKVLGVVPSKAVIEELGRSGNYVRTEYKFDGIVKSGFVFSGGLEPYIERAGVCNIISVSSCSDEQLCSQATTAQLGWGRVRESPLADELNRRGASCPEYDKLVVAIKTEKSRGVSNEVMKPKPKQVGQDDFGILKITNEISEIINTTEIKNNSSVHYDIAFSGCSLQATRGDLYLVGGFNSRVSGVISQVIVSLRDLDFEKSRVYGDNFLFTMKRGKSLSFKSGRFNFERSVSPLMAEAVTPNMLASTSATMERQSQIRIFSQNSMLDREDVKSSIGQLAEICADGKGQ